MSLRFLILVYLKSLTNFELTSCSALSDSWKILTPFPNSLHNISKICNLLYILYHFSADHCPLNYMLSFGLKFFSWLFFYVSMPYHFWFLLGMDYSWIYLFLFLLKNSVGCLGCNSMPSVNYSLPSVLLGQLSEKSCDDQSCHQGEAEVSIDTKC